MDNPLIRLRKGLRLHFGPGAECCVDSCLYLAGYVCLDIIRLDMWLHRRNLEYLEDESLNDFINRAYGEQAELFVEHWITGEHMEEARQEAA